MNTVTDTRDHSVFGHIDQTTVSVTRRVNYTISPTLSLQLYGQPFVSGGYYANLRELVDGRNRRTPRGTRPTTTRTPPTARPTST